jgi:hypothetical protein
MARSANEDEAAAIAAAIARFETETAAPAEDGAAIVAWQRAALLEGVSAKGVVEDIEGGSRWLS